MTTTGEPVSAARRLSRPPFGERVRRKLERIVERIFFRRRIGVLTVRRALRLNAKDDPRALDLLRLVANDHDCAPTLIAVATLVEAQALLEAGDESGSNGALERVVEDDLPPAAQKSRAQLRAHAARRRRDFAAMLAIADAQLAGGADSDLLFTRAIALHNLDRLPEALAALDDALHLRPNDGLLHLARAGYRFLAGEATARAELDEVLRDEHLDHRDDVSWSINCAWVTMLIRDDDNAFARLTALLTRATPTVARRVLRYIEAERDFDRVRDDPRMHELRSLAQSRGA